MRVSGCCWCRLWRHLFLRCVRVLISISFASWELSLPIFCNFIWYRIVRFLTGLSLLGFIGVLLPLSDPSVGCLLGFEGFCVGRCWFCYISVRAFFVFSSFFILWGDLAFSGTVETPHHQCIYWFQPISVWLARWRRVCQIQRVTPRDLHIIYHTFSEESYKFALV